MVKETHSRFNPFSSKGQIGFYPFVVSLVVLMSYNILVWQVLIKPIMDARVSLDVRRALELYVIWALLTSIGYFVITNLFIKRWARLINVPQLKGVLRSVIRLSLLSPTLSVVLFSATILFFPTSVLNVLRNGKEKGFLKFLLVMVLFFGGAIAAVLPNRIYGIQNIHLKDSVKKLTEFYHEGGIDQFPTDEVFKAMFSVASPAARYLGLMAADFIRLRYLAKAVQEYPNDFCKERLGFLGVEVPDCFLFQLRKMSEQAAFVSPAFTLYYESNYRKEKMSEVQREITDLPRATEQSSTDIAAQSSLNLTKHAVPLLATSLLSLSNQLELMEVGPILHDRRGLIEPEVFLRLMGSPELVFIELGQDAQRYTLVKKLMPLFKLEATSAQKVFEQIQAIGANLWPEQLNLFKAQLAEIDVRISKLEKDPLAINLTQ